MKIDIRSAVQAAHEEYKTSGEDVGASIIGAARINGAPFMVTVGIVPIEEVTFKIIEAEVHAIEDGPMSILSVGTKQ